MRYIQKGVGCPWRRFLWRSSSLTLLPVNDLNWFWYVPFKYIPWYGLEWVLVSQRANYTKQGINLKSWSSFSPFIFISTKSEVLPAEKTTTVQYDLYDILISQSILFNRRNFIFSVLINRNINVDSFAFNPLNTSPTKWSDIRKQFVEKILRIVWLCLTILWGCLSKG